MKSLTTGGAAALALTIGISAQQPQTPRSPTPAPSPGQMVTVEGCVMREADVPGRKPNVAERAGITEDYILTDARMIKGSAPQAAAQMPGGAQTGTSGSQGAMYEIEGLDEARLKQHVGHRVQLDGTFENIDRARATPERSTPADDLVEIRATAIRQVAGACTTK